MNTRLIFKKKFKKKYIEKNPESFFIILPVFNKGHKGHYFPLSTLAMSLHILHLLHRKSSVFILIICSTVASCTYYFQYNCP